MNIKNIFFIFLLIFLIYYPAQCSDNTKGYDYAYKNYSLKVNQSTAVLIICYNRPEYLKECIKSLEANKENTETIFIFSLDGGCKSAEKENHELIEHAMLKHKIILTHDHNYGCPKHHIDAHRFAFDWCHFENVITIQEDITITPQFISFMKNMHTWATNTYSNIGATGVFSYSFLSPEEKKLKSNLKLLFKEHY